MGFETKLTRPRSGVAGTWSPGAWPPNQKEPCKPEFSIPHHTHPVGKMDFARKGCRGLQHSTTASGHTLGLVSLDAQKLRTAHADPPTKQQFPGKRYASWCGAKLCEAPLSRSNRKENRSRTKEDKKLNSRKQRECPLLRTLAFSVQPLAFLNGCSRQGRRTHQRPDQPALG